MNPEVVRQVGHRAAGRCEYCRLPEAAQFLPFQMDHIIAKKHGGTDGLSNLALACVHCNRYQGPNIAGIAPGSEEAVRLYNPRTDRWPDHFRWHGVRIEPMTAIGRVTAQVLNLNNPEVLLLREALLRERLVL